MATLSPHHTLHPLTHPLLSYPELWTAWTIRLKYGVETFLPVYHRRLTSLTGACPSNNM